MATLARDHEFTFLDHSLRHGDSLVGYTAKQAAAFNWEPTAQETLIQERVRRDIALVAEGRRRILDAQDGTPYAQLSQELGKLEEKLKIARNLGDVLVSAFFGGKNARTREAARQALLHDVDLAFGNKPDAEAGVRLDKIGAEIRARSKPLVPFHWELEFPEVFALDRSLRPDGGFDTIVGNPPFAGKNTLIEGSPDDYIEWLKQLHPESHGNADLVAHFFRRAFNLLRPDGTFGLIATNTIAQGDTRSSGLRWICMNGGMIYRALKRHKWPGEAAVVVSVIHVSRKQISGPYILSGRVVQRISAFLFHSGGDADPVMLGENEDIGFQGCVILGAGFTFLEGGGSEASNFDFMRSLIARDERNGDRIQPYIGGEDLSDSPTQRGARSVINFEGYPCQKNSVEPKWHEASEQERNAQLRVGVVPLDYPYPVAEDWPDLMTVLRERVYPIRQADNRENYRRFWWQFAERRPGLTRSKAKLSRVIVTSKTNKYRCFSMLTANQVFDQSLIVFASESWAFFSSLSSRIHEAWSLFLGSSLKDDPAYTPSICFETFPLPIHLLDSAQLDAHGRAYHEFRSALMIRNNEGLTKTYNRFHRPDENSTNIIELRRLHDAMDRAVLDAYGWHDLQPIPAFFPEFDDEDEEDEGGRPSRPKQKKYRYRWPDEVHDEVLARLLALNLERAALQRPPDTIAPSKAKKAKLKSKPSINEEPGLF